MDNVSLTVGGPLYHFYIRSGLAAPPIEKTRRRILFFLLVTWIPLVVLTAIEGQLYSGSEVPFLYHVAVHVRLLICLPLLIAAESIVRDRIDITVHQFLERGLIAEEDRPRFEKAIATAIRWRNSTFVEIVLLVLSFTAGHWLWKQFGEIQNDIWYAGNATRSFTLSGFWYAFVSLSVLRFLLFRWYFRLVIWYRFLWQVSRIPLRLNALHPDRAGGLGFLAGTPNTLLCLMLAHTFAYAGLIADHIWHQSAKLTSFQMEILFFVLIFTVVAYCPLMFFTLQLARARRQGVRDYGTFAARYVNEFREKWIEHRQEQPAHSLGSSDIQSLADLDGSYGVVREMRATVFPYKAIVVYAVLLALPLLPLIFTMFPIEEILARLFKMVM